MTFGHPDVKTFESGFQTSPSVAKCVSQRLQTTKKKVDHHWSKRFVDATNERYNLLKCILAKLCFHWEGMKSISDIKRPDLKEVQKWDPWQETKHWWCLIFWDIVIQKWDPPSRVRTRCTEWNFTTQTALSVNTDMKHDATDDRLARLLCFMIEKGEKNQAVQCWRSSLFTCHWRQSCNCMCKYYWGNSNNKKEVCVLQFISQIYPSVI